MTKTEQKRFVRDLARSVASEIILSITTGRIPPSWNGHELRMLMAERFAAEGRVSEIAKDPKHKRAIAYRNHCIVANL